MPRFSVELEPGVVRSGTELQTSGFYFDTDGVRWQNKAMQPEGGWAQVSIGAVSGKARAIRVWVDNTNQAKTVIGTHTGLFAMDRPGNLYDISPSGLVAGRADSDNQGGYGNDFYGRGTYGTPRPFSLDAHDVTVWTLDTFGQDLVCCNADDGTVYEWLGNTGAIASPVANAPSARTLVVTAQQNLMIGGANGNPRRIKWSNRDDITDWTDSLTNYAGSWDLQTTGRIMAMRRVPEGVLIVTSSDAWVAEDRGFPLVYGFLNVGGAGTGIVSQGAIATIDGETVPMSAMWMAPQGFMGFNGTVQPLSCPVHDFVFSNINRAQISKVSVLHDADFGELKFFYPSATSLENDSIVTYNYREDWWSLGHSGVRLCGSERGPLSNPLCVDTDGKVYKHEYGLDRGGAEPYAETGDFLVGQGDKVIRLTKIIPDERTLGDVSVKVFSKFQPADTATEHGPYTLKSETDVRLTARLLRLRYTGARLAPWRVGRFVCDGTPGGTR